MEKLGENIYRQIDRSGWTAAQTAEYAHDYWMPSIPRWDRVASGIAKVEPPVGKKPNFNEKEVPNPIYAPYLEPDLFPNILYTADQSRQLADKVTAIDGYAQQKWAEWITGQANVDAEWDVYVAELNRLGLQDVLKIRREALANTKKALGN
jgi:putative aldouronate transport system substrate-binding protein